MTKRKQLQTVNQYLRMRRESLGFSQGYVAKKLGFTSPQFVSNWERGLCGPPKSSLKKIIRILNIPVDEYIELVLENQRVELNKLLR